MRELPDERGYPAPSGFCVDTLKLTDFRNYATATLDLDPGMVVITGANGAGKTNLLEALSLLTPGRGLRGADHASLSRGGPDGGRAWAVSGRIAHLGGAITVGTGLDPNQVSASTGRASRVVRMDGETVPVSRLAGLMKIVWLTPAQDGLFSGPEADRRQFIDRMAVTLFSDHSSQLAAFEKLMRQRNRLLEDANPDGAWLNAIEQDMAAHGVAIAHGRLETLQRLSDAENQRRAESALFPAVGIEIEGQVEADLRAGSATGAEDAYRARLQDGRRQDARAGRTLDGPHRSKLQIRHVLKDMPAALCSTGEQKALLVGLTLAHARILRSAHQGQMPQLLLDEITAHLDDIRREALFDTVGRMGGQAVMTGTDRSAFAPLHGLAQTVDVTDASLTAW